jgi:hypothetical protein
VMASASVLNVAELNEGSFKRTWSSLPAG